jgi:hypothetical protein
MDSGWGGSQAAPVWPPRARPQAFATFGDSINTCFEILLGNIDVNKELRALGGLQSVAGALFFW